MQGYFNILGCISLIYHRLSDHTKEFENLLQSDYTCCTADTRKANIAKVNEDSKWLGHNSTDKINKENEGFGFYFGKYSSNNELTLHSYLNSNFEVWDTLKDLFEKNIIKGKFEYINFSCAAKSFDGTMRKATCLKDLRLSPQGYTTRTPFRGSVMLSPKSRQPNKGSTICSPLFFGTSSTSSSGSDSGSSSPQLLRPTAYQINRDTASPMNRRGSLHSPVNNNPTAVPRQDTPNPSFLGRTKQTGAAAFNLGDSTTTLQQNGTAFNLDNKQTGVPRQDTPSPSFLGKTKQTGVAAFNLGKTKQQMPGQQMAGLTNMENPYTSSQLNQELSEDPGMIFTDLYNPPLFLAL